MPGITCTREIAKFEIVSRLLQVAAESLHCLDQAMSDRNPAPARNAVAPAQGGQGQREESSFFDIVKVGFVCDLTTSGLYYL